MGARVGLPLDNDSGLISGDGLMTGCSNMRWELTLQGGWRELIKLGLALSLIPRLGLRLRLIVWLRLILWLILWLRLILRLILWLRD